MNQVTPLTRADDESTRSPSPGPLPRVLLPAVLLNKWPQLGGRVTGDLSGLDVRLAIEAAGGCSTPDADRDVRGLTGAGQAAST